MYPAGLSFFGFFLYNGKRFWLYVWMEGSCQADEKDI